MSEMKHARTGFGLRLGICMLGAALVALVFYSLTLAGYVFPGESTHLFTQWMGMDALTAPNHPLWGGVAKAIAGMSFPSSVAVRINLVSLLCGVLSAGLLCGLVGFYVRGTMKDEDAVPLRRPVSEFAGLVAALVFVFSTAVWQTSTHLDYHLFDVFLALVAFAVFVPMVLVPRAFLAWSALLGLLVGAGLVESVVFVPLVPLFLLGIVTASVKTGRKFYLPTLIFLVVTGVCYLLFVRMVALAYLQLPEAAAGGFRDVGDVMVKNLQTAVREMRLWHSRPGWLIVLAISVAPFLACMFVAPRGLNNERTWSQYLFHAAMTLTAILAVATPLAPESVMRPFGIAPVATSTLVAVTCGYLAGYWILLARAPLPAADSVKTSPAVKAGRRIAPVALGAFLLILALSLLVNVFSVSRDRGAFADTCANAIIDRLGDRTWFITDGLLDDHLRIAAATRGKELNLVCLQRDTDEAYHKELGALVAKRKLAEGVKGLDLTLSIPLGVMPFLQDWFKSDPKVTEKAAIFGVPDFWFLANCKPVPEALFFGGVKDLKEVDGAKALAAFREFWGSIESTLYVVGKKGSRAISDEKDPMDALRLQLRRHVGFIANNLGVLLQDLGMNKEAFEVYELVLKTIDRDNICTLFNEFEMARAGDPAAASHQADIIKQLKAIVDDPKRRYVLWSLSRYYGYIRSPEIFAKMGYGWTLSAQNSIAAANIEKATDLVPKERQAGLRNLLAASLATAGKDGRTESRKVYLDVLAKDPSNHDAHMGLARIALMAGNLDEAKTHLNEAVKVAKNPETSGFDWALLHLLGNNLPAARLALQKVTDLQPKSLQAWSLLAGVLLQQFDQEREEAKKKKILEELDDVILPRMEVIAGSPRDYYVQMTRALVMMRKGKHFQKQVRDALVTASASRPDVATVRDMILNLDIAMNDTESAKTHAHQVLRLDRANKLANYVMGSLRLQENDYAEAERFLRISADQEQPLPAAQNDLSEVLRRQGKHADAEKYARAAIKNAPELYVVWETLASALLDQNKDLDEAKAAVEQAIKLSKSPENPNGDVRMLITLARVQLAKQDTTGASVTLRTLNKFQKELSKYDIGELEKLQRQLKSSSKK